MIESKAEPFLVLDLDVGEREFLDIDELQEWVNQERTDFKWLDDLYRIDNAAGNAWNLINGLHNTIDNFIREYRNHPGNVDVQKRLIGELRDKARHYVWQNHHVKSSDSADVQFVLEVRKTRTDTVAGYALSSLMEQGVNINITKAFEGAFLAMQYKSGITATVDAERNALNSLKKGWASRFGKQHRELIRKGEGLTSQIEEHKDTFAAVKDKLDAFHGSEEEKFQNLYTKIEKELSDIKRTYDEELALKSSVRYWTRKGKDHGSAMKWLAACTFISAAVTTWLFLSAVHELSLETAAEVPLWKISILLAISTVGIWLTRLFTKIFISNLHLKTDADERVTMMLTYLALLRKGNGPPENERQLMLQTLFRPSSAGLIQEDGPAGALELLKLFKK